VLVTLRDYQLNCLNDALTFVTSTAAPAHRLYSAPTGTGKGTIQLALQDALNEQGLYAWIVTPRLEIIRGYLERLDVAWQELTERELWEAADNNRISTPVRFRNRLMTGTHTPPDVVICDESHHNVDSNVVTADLFALTYAHWIGFTATPYRATPKQTQLLRENWGAPVEILTWPSAIEGGWAAAPKVRTVPLVDDDRIALHAGDFQGADACTAYATQIDKLADLCAEYNDGVPTMISVPGTEIAKTLEAALLQRLVSAEAILQDTPTSRRSYVLEELRAGRMMVIHINVITEGVDIPELRRLIDAQPTLSPVRWVQQVGRITRPGDIEPEVICTNRNIERHAYLFHGVWPSTYVVEAQEAWEAPSSRTGLRHMGLEPLARYKKLQVPLLKGGYVTVLQLYKTEKLGRATQELCVFIPPGGAEPIVAHRTNSPPQWGTWRLGPLPDDMRGWLSSKWTGDATDKQLAWWRRAAWRHGLDQNYEPTKREFQIMPVLKDLGARLGDA